MNLRHFFCQIAELLQKYVIFVLNSSLYNVYRQNGLILTQDDIGDIIGESRLDVARAFRNLRDLNIVSTSRGSVTILDKEKLFRLTSYLR